jgi:membrane-associated phospholipid phosphatase
MTEHAHHLVVRRLGQVLLLVTLSFASSAHAANPPDTTQLHSPAISAEAQKQPPVPHLFTGGDLMFLGGTIAGTTVAMLNDRALTDKAIEVENNPDQRRVAQFFQPLGRTTYVVPAALALYGAARLTGHPHVARRSGRVALAVMISTTVTQGIKQAVGRERPLDSPTNSTSFHPFSGSSSFPSGHAVTAFAAAVALDRETSGRWVPYVVYPAAAMVAWSRVHDRKHWTSDVISGAALGSWTAWKTETFLANHSIGVPRKDENGNVEGTNTVSLLPEPGGFRIGLVHMMK